MAIGQLIAGHAGGTGFTTAATPAVVERTPVALK